MKRPPSRSMHRRAGRRLPRSERRRRAHDERLLERNLDQLLLRVAAESDLAIDPEAERDPGHDPISADVERWLRARGSTPTPSPSGTRAPAPMRERSGPSIPSWARASAIAVGLCAATLATYWRSPEIQLPGAPARAHAYGESSVYDERGDSESWYVRIAQASDAVHASATRLAARRCSVDSWYCVQVLPGRARHEL